MPSGYTTSQSIEHRGRATATGRRVALLGFVFLSVLLQTRGTGALSVAVSGGGEDAATNAGPVPGPAVRADPGGPPRTDRAGIPETLVEICEWQGGAAGAASISIDDACLSCRDLLNQHGFKGTYYLSGTDTFAEAEWALWRSVYEEGHELGGHTTTHVSCHNLEAATLRWELFSNKIHILTNVGMPAEELTSFAWPRGDCSAASKAIASEYYISARGYHINALEDKDPCDFMNLKSINTPHYHPPAYDPPDGLQMADQAEALGKWANYVFHNHCQDDGLIAYLATKNLWVAPVGRVAKYIRERQNTRVEDVTHTESQITFTLVCSLDPQLFNQALTVRVRVNPACVRSVYVNGSSARCARDTDHLLFNVRPSGKDEVVVALAGGADRMEREFPASGQEPQDVRSRRSPRLEMGNGAVINIWISGSARLDNLRMHRIKYLFVDVGDTGQDGRITTPTSQITDFLRLIKAYQMQHAYTFVVLPYSEINTGHYMVTRPFLENVLADYKRLLALGFDGIYVDVEPVCESLREEYLQFLAQSSALCGQTAALGVYAGNISASQADGKNTDEWQWSRSFYHEVSRRVDLIVVPGYDFNLKSREEYMTSVSEQIDMLVAENLNCRLMFTVPTHKREPETIGNALTAYNRAIRKYSRHPFIGVCVFAEWTTIPDDWNIFESGLRP